jgi:hypothetical protein
MCEKVLGNGSRGCHYKSTNLVRVRINFCRILQRALLENVVVEKGAVKAFCVCVVVQGLLACQESYVVA